MPIKTIYCHVRQSQVSLVTDFEDRVTHVICPGYDAATRACRLKQSASSGGPLTALVVRVSEDILASRGVRCDYAA